MRENQKRTIEINKLIEESKRKRIDKIYLPIYPFIHPSIHLSIVVSFGWCSFLGEQKNFGVSYDSFLKIIYHFLMCSQNFISTLLISL